MKKKIASQPFQNLLPLSEHLLISDIIYVNNKNPNNKNNFLNDYFASKDA
jgi:hypothetical protein